MNQLIRMMLNNPRLLNQETSLNFKCPYHAKVMKVLERIRRAIVVNPLAILYINNKMQNYEIDWNSNMKNSFSFE